MTMYSIGEFSRMNRITPKTLRHYERICLLQPAAVDAWTGYRSYSTEQLAELGELLHLKELGFSLTEIRVILREGVSRQAFLERREAEILSAMAREESRLAGVRQELEKLKGVTMSQEKIVLKELPEVTAASLRTTIPSYDSYFEIVPKMGEYMASVGAVCREPAYCFTIYHDGEYREADIDVEICEAVVEPRQESDRIQFRTVPGAPRAACLIHRGPYSTLGGSYNRLFVWIADQGMEPLGPPRESYIDGIWNRENPEEWVTEIQIPV